MPDGRKRQTAFEVSGATADKARTILDRGWVFEVEILSTMEVSLTVSDGENDVAIEISPNGMEVPEAIERLIEAAESQPDPQHKEQ